MASPGPPVLSRFAARIGRYAAIFGAGSAASVALSLVLVAFLTRHLSPAEYGQLAVYLLVPSLLMVMANLGSLQGTMGVVFGHGGEEGFEGPSDVARATDPRGALGTGLLLTLAVGTVLAAIAWAAASPLAHALGDQPNGASLVRIGAVSGAIGGIWRLLANFLRYARRPVASVITTLARPAIALGVAIPLVLDGRGLEGVVIAFAIATAAATVVALGWTMGDIRLSFRPRTVREIYFYGGPLMPVGLSFWTFQSADVYAVSALASPHDAGIYRVASAIARGASYLVAAFTQSLPPVFGSPLRDAVEREAGRAGTGAAILIAYSLAAPWAILTLGALADQLVRIAPPSFSSAAGLIPLLALVPIARGWLVSVYIASQRADRRGWLAGLAAAAVPVWIGGVMLLIPPFGGHGAALSGATGFFLPATVLLVLGQRSASPLSLPWRRLAAGPVTAAFLLVIVRLTTPDDGTVVQLMTAAVVIAAYPVVLVLVRALPAAGVRIVLRRIPSTVARMGRRRRASTQLTELAPAEVRLLEEVVKRRIAIDEVAGSSGTSPADVEQRVHRLLRELAGVDELRRTDASVLRYLLFEGPAGERAALARELITRGVDPLALDQLEVQVASLRRLPRRAYAGPSR